MRRLFVLSTIAVFAGLLVVPAVASAGGGRYRIPLIPCSQPGFAVCFGSDLADGAGKLTLKKGHIEVDIKDGEVKVVLRGVSGPTVAEAGPPYTFQLFFFTVSKVNLPPDPIVVVGMPFTTKVKSDEFGNFTGVVGNITGPLVGFFAVNSRGPGDNFEDYFAGAREQFLTGAPQPAPPGGGDD
jgi:hypothetical protein